MEDERPGGCFEISQESDLANEVFHYDTAGDDMKQALLNIMNQIKDVFWHFLGTPKIVLLIKKPKSDTRFGISDQN